MSIYAIHRSTESFKFKRRELDEDGETWTKHGLNSLEIRILLALNFDFFKKRNSLALNICDHSLLFN
jgi:hypothetical protein